MSECAYSPRPFKTLQVLPNSGIKDKSQGTAEEILRAGLFFQHGRPMSKPISPRFSRIASRLQGPGFVHHEAIEPWNLVFQNEHIS